MSITNRSRLWVAVKHRDDLYREFPYNKLAAAEAYRADLRAQGFKPALGQFEDTFEVRIRRKGQPALSFTARSPQEAEDIVSRVAEERRRGLFVDYTKAHRVTFADLIRRYMQEEGPQHKGWEKVEKYKCQGWLDDLAGGPAKRGMMRERMTSLEWMEKPFAAVDTMDIVGYIRDRLEVVQPSTVDREVDVLSAICNVAIDVWKYRVPENPMVGVKRPRYFNERDRRLRPGEEARLLDAARAVDRERCIEKRLDVLMADTREVAAQAPTLYARKHRIKAARALLRPQAEAEADYVPLFEAFVQFQIMTAARRGETLSLTWDNVDFEGRTAYLPETKNGRPRKLPLRADLLAMLAGLPRCGTRVFPLSADALKKAWARMLDHAGIADLHVHDLRHEGISLVAETGGFSLVDLQAFSGHRDTRMLLRYAHLCTTRLAKRLDQAFGSAVEPNKTTTHRGRRRLRAGSGLTLAAIAADAPVEASYPAASGAPRPTAEVIAFPRRSA